MILELCANGFESALIGQEVGVDRIELCENLSVGGLTPPKKLIEKVIQEVHIPIHVLIRPRAGDFNYTEQEIAAMVMDIQFCRKLGCAGIVSGVLTKDRMVDITKTQRLLEASEGMEFTFHRAIDVCRDPIMQVHALKKLRITRLLSSGQASSAVEGMGLLNKIYVAIEGAFQLMPGGGITSNNVLQFQEQGFEMVHFSAIPKTTSATSLFENKVVGISNKHEIEIIKALLS